MTLQGVHRDGEQPGLHLVSVRDDASEVVATRAGDRGDEVADEPTRARFGRGDGDALVER